MGKLTDMLHMQMGTGGEEVKSSKLLRCPECKSEGIPSHGRRSGKWLAVHFAGCSRSTVTGDSREDVNQKWKEQNS